MTRWLREIQVALGRTVAIAAGVAVAAGIAVVATGMGDADRPRTFAALSASWLFFAGLAAGGLAFRAFFELVDARWTRPLASIGGALVGFAPVALVVLAVISLGASSWVHADADSTWMSVGVLSIRELGLTAALFGCGVLLRRSSGVLAIVYLIAFAIVLSIWAFDLVLGADPVFESTLIGPFLFMGAFTAATGLVVIAGLRRGLLADGARRDAAGLIIALSIFWAYLFWSQYLTIWYGNLPDEVAFALRRVAGGWGAVVLAVIGLVFALPFVVLLHPVARRSSRVLVTLLALQLLGFWLCCHLLVVPSLTPNDAPVVTVRDALIALGMLGAFALSVAPGMRTTTAPSSQGANSGARVELSNSKKKIP